MVGIYCQLYNISSGCGGSMFLPKKIGAALFSCWGCVGFSGAWCWWGGVKSPPFFATRRPFGKRKGFAGSAGAGNLCWPFCLEAVCDTRSVARWALLGDKFVCFGGWDAKVFRFLRWPLWPRFDDASRLGVGSHWRSWVFSRSISFALYF